MEEIEIRKLDIELIPDIESENNGLNVQGYIAVNSPSHILGKENGKKWREIIEPGTFKNALAKAKRLKQDIDFLADHDNNKILSSTANNSLFLEEDEVGLYIDAKVSETTWGKDLYVLVRDGIIKGLSFGMKVLREDWTMSSDGLPLRTISEIDLFEISALKVPAYPTTLLESRGLEVSEVEIPNDIEKRNLQGGNTVLSDNQEVTPQMIYNGMTLIAEKLDAIVTKIDTMDSNKTIKGLEEAKLVLAEAKTVAELTAGKTVGADEDPNKDPNKDTTLEEEDKKAVDNENELPLEEESKDEELEEKTEDSEEEVVTTDETKPLEEKEEVDAETKETVETKDEAEVVKTPEEIEEDEEEEEKRKKKALKEVRCWLSEAKIMEVPENE